MNNRISVHIYNNKYPITTSEDAGYVNGLAAEIDKTVTNLMRAGGISINQALVIASLSYIDSYKKSEEGTDNLRKQIAEYAEEAARARAELAEARKEIDRLSRPLQKVDQG